MADANDYWKSYQIGQGSADHTDRVVFCEVVQPIIDEIEQYRLSFLEIKAFAKAALHPDCINPNMNISAIKRECEKALLTKNTERKLTAAETCGKDWCPVADFYVRCSKCELFIQPNWSLPDKDKDSTPPQGGIVKNVCAHCGRAKGHELGCPFGRFPR